VHLEGPFLNPQKRGAHPEYLLPLTIDPAGFGDYADVVGITLAPELDQLGRQFLICDRSALQLVSVTLKPAAQAQQAFQVPQW